MTNERVYRPHSPTRTVGPKVYGSADECQGMVGILNQGCLALGVEQDWRVQSSPLSWEDHE